MSNSIGIGKRKMSNSIGIGKPKMSLSIGIGKKTQKPYYIQIFLREEVFLAVHKKWLLELAHFAQAKKLLALNSGKSLGNIV